MYIQDIIHISVYQHIQIYLRILMRSPWAKTERPQNNKILNWRVLGFIRGLLRNGGSLKCRRGFMGMNSYNLQFITCKGEGEDYWITYTSVSLSLQVPRRLVRECWEWGVFGSNCIRFSLDSYRYVSGFSFTFTNHISLFESAVWRVWLHLSDGSILNLNTICRGESL